MKNKRKLVPRVGAASLSSPLEVGADRSAKAATDLARRLADDGCDVVPLGAVYIADSCTYHKPPRRPQPCDSDLSQLWQEDLETYDRIITTLDMRITAGTMKFPVKNCAYLTWDGGQKELCVTTIVVGPRIFLPLILWPQARPTDY